MHAPTWRRIFNTSRGWVIARTENPVNEPAKASTLVPSIYHIWGSLCLFRKSQVKINWLKQVFKMVFFEAKLTKYIMILVDFIKKFLLLHFFIGKKVHG